MTMTCKLCKSSQNIQDCVIALKDEGASHRTIETELASRFQFKIASTSVGHHLNHCLKKKGEAPTNEESLNALETLARSSPDNPTIRHALRNILAKAIIQFDLKMMQEQQDSPHIHLETIRSLETLVNIQDKLYPQKQGVGEGESFRNKSISILESFTEEEKRALIAQDRR